MDIGDKMHPSKMTQIANLKLDKASIKVSSKYANFVNVFLSKLAIELPKYIGINDHIMKLGDHWQFLYKSIYRLSLIKLEILKIYIGLIILLDSSNLLLEL